MSVSPTIEDPSKPVGTLVENPLDILLPYQRKFVQDQARFKIGMWSRQVGKSFAAAAEIVGSSLANPGSEWVVLSAGERQSLDFMRKVHQWAKAFDFAISQSLELRDAEETLLKRAEVLFNNGSRVIALPAKPETARGYSANLLLDEFAFHDQPDEIWRAIYPSVSNPLKGELKLRIISTPNGKSNKFYDLWTKDNGYSKHKVTIHDAVADGLPVNVEELQRAIDDSDGWSQEYLCEFIDNTSVLLPYDLIRPCEFDGGIEDSQVEDRVVGIDIGRKHDLSVAWELLKVGDVWYTGRLVELAKTEFHIQLDEFLRIGRDASRVRVDATGIGAMLAEEMARHLGSKVEQCQFTSAFKQDIFTNLRRGFEEKTVRIPVRRDVREDLHALQKITTNSGAVRYMAPHRDDGHSDRATALALALSAATEPQSFGWYF